MTNGALCSHSPLALLLITLGIEMTNSALCSWLRLRWLGMDGRSQAASDALAIGRSCTVDGFSKLLCSHWGGAVLFFYLTIFK